MARLPTVGGDTGTWGDVLNEFLTATVGAQTFALNGSVAEGATSFTLSTAPDFSADTGWFLIDPWTTSCELWLPTSISGAGVTCATQTEETLTASNISFTASTKRISTSPTTGTVSKFFPGEKILVSGSASNNGTFTVAPYPVDGSYDGTYLTTVEALSNESSGASITIRRKRRAHADGATVLFTSGPIHVTWYGAKASGDTGDASVTRAALQRCLDDSFYAHAYDIYMPGFMGGRYYIDAPLYVEKQTHLRGVNQKASVISADSDFPTWNDDVAMLQTRRSGLTCKFLNGGNDRYFFSHLGLDASNVAHAKSTGYDASADTAGTAFITAATNTVAVHASLIKDNGDNTRIVYRALSGGTGGNSVQIAHVNDGANQALTVTASGSNITVHLATNGASVVTSTAAAVVSAVNGDVDSNGLVEASLGYAGDQKFNSTATTLGVYNDGTGVVGTFALTSLVAGTAPFVSGDVGRSIYLGTRYGARNIATYVNAYTVTVGGAAFANSKAGLRFAVSPLNGLLGSYNQTSIIDDLRIENCAGYAFCATGCQEFTVKNLMTLFSGVHLRLYGVQFGHFYDNNMEHTLDAYVSFEGVSGVEINRSNHFIGGHTEDVAPCDFFRASGNCQFEGLYVIDYQSSTNSGSRVLRIEQETQIPSSYGIMGYQWAGPNVGPIFVSDAKRGYSLAMADFSVSGTSAFTVDHFFVREGNIQANRNVRSRSSAYTMRHMDKIVLADATASPFTVTLPPADPIAGMVFTIKRMNAGGNAVSVDPDASETIDGSSTPVSLAAQYDRITVMSDGANWVRVD